MIETPAEILEHDASADAVRSFVAWRKAIRCPLTERAAVLIAKSLREITADGGDADEALDLTQEHGWKTIKPSWYWRVKHEGYHGAGIPDRRGNRVDHALEQISRLARVGKASGNGRG